MTITTQPLSDHEKKLLRRVFKIRVIFSLIFLLPILFMIFIATLDDSLFSYYDVMSFFPIALISLVCFLIFKYAVPFFINSYKNTKETKKMVIVTKVENIERTIFKGVRYVVKTDYKTIDSYAISIIDNQPPFLFSDLYIGMLIEIHCLENNKIDILKIKKYI